MQVHTVRVLSYTGRFIRRQLQFDFTRGSLFVTIGQQDWYVEAAGAHFVCTRPRVNPVDGAGIQEAKTHA